MVLEKHHQDSIARFLDEYQNDETILAILLGGSIAHGFAKPESDIDIMVIVTETEYQKRKSEQRLTFCRWDICTYEGGYIDCKVVSIDFLSLIAERGSDPARFAFKDSIVLFSRLDHLDELLRKVATFNVGQKEERRNRFAAQLLAWQWYYSEAVTKHNNYLVHLAIQKIILFSCRIILNENNLLYPYHKWLLAVAKSAREKPELFDARLAAIMVEPSPAQVEQYIREILSFLNLEESKMNWPNQFLIDSELNWLDHEPPVDDL